MVGRRGPVPGMVLLEDDRPVVYCVPVRRRVVFTTGALRRLDRPELDAVLAHERAHLAGRHHLVIIFATAMRGAFPGIPFCCRGEPDRLPGGNGRRRCRRPAVAPADAGPCAADAGRGAGARRSPRRRGHRRGSAHPAPHRVTTACQPGAPGSHVGPRTDRRTHGGLLCTRPGRDGHLRLPGRRHGFPPGRRPPAAGDRRWAGTRPGFRRIATLGEAGPQAGADRKWPGTPHNARARPGPGSNTPDQWPGPPGPVTGSPPCCSTTTRSTVRPGPHRGY